MNLHALIQKSGLSFQQSPASENCTITGLALDSRAVKPGFLFAALAGEQNHGSTFVSAAIQNGAVCILSDQPIPELDIPVLVHTDAHHALAKLARGFYPDQPKNMIAITGTNGKSSVVEFLRQIWMNDGCKAASIGTLGMTTATQTKSLGYTTPDCILLHQGLQALHDEQICHCALEASSHGLVQHRLDAVDFTAAGFTNLTQDHFDYHGDFETYYHAKQRLFLELLPIKAPVVINVDDQYGIQMANDCVSAGLHVWRIGWSGEDIKLLEVQPYDTGQQLHIRVLGAHHRIALPLVGEFQAANALMALGLVMQSGMDAPRALAAIIKLTGVRGRMELAAHTHNNVPILVDFAHSPDALQKLLQAIRPHTKGRILVVFGCGGDRDPQKRPLMGAIAHQSAEIVIVTDDNPRSETSADIRASILAKAENALEIADRRTAIARAIELAEPGDTIVIAGKGHEQGQIVGDTVFAFDDASTARELAEATK